MSKVSFASISNPEFINLQPLDINPLMSACEIKVFYLGQNRNRSYIDKEVATEMAKTLRGAPIVGYYNEEKGDFRDHGDQMVWDGDGIQFNCLTKPYGFVSPDAKVWFQKFEETDEFGNTTEREYLMTTGYLWTGQFEECQRVIDEGRPHSMELDDDTCEGHWAEDYNKNIEFFIIHDAIFSKLCILGKDVEPCFEGSTVTAPEVSKNFTIDNNFSQTLYTMMQELKFALEGGAKMVETNVQVTTEQQEEVKFSATQDNLEQNNTAENNVSTEEGSAETSFEKKEDEEEKKPTEESSEEDKDKEDKEKVTKNACQDDDDDDKKKYTVLETQYNELSKKYNEMETAYQSLVEFKNQIENEKKDKMIERFFMLSAEDKKDVIDNKSKYSLDEIQSKLSVIYTNKQLELENQKKDKENDKEKDSDSSDKPGVITYSISSDSPANLPDWVKAVRETEQQINA